MKGSQAEGILQSVEEVQLTIVRGKRSFVVQKDVIKRVQVRKPDPLAEGIAGGLLYALIAHVAFGGGGAWTTGETAWNYVSSAGLGAFIDWRIKNYRTVYRAP